MSTDQPRTKELFVPEFPSDAFIEAATTAAKGIFEIMGDRPATHADIAAAVLAGAEYGWDTLSGFMEYQAKGDPTLFSKDIWLQIQEVMKVTGVTRNEDGSVTASRAEVSRRQRTLNLLKSIFNAPDPTNAVEPAVKEEPKGELQIQIQMAELLERIANLTTLMRSAPTDPLQFAVRTDDKKCLGCWSEAVTHVGEFLNINGTPSEPCGIPDDRAHTLDGFFEIVFPPDNTSCARCDKPIVVTSESASKIRYVGGGYVMCPECSIHPDVISTLPTTS